MAPFAANTLLAAATDVSDPTVEEVEANALAAAAAPMEVDDDAAVPDYSPVVQDDSGEVSSTSSADPGR